MPITQTGIRQYGKSNRPRLDFVNLTINSKTVRQIQNTGYRWPTRSLATSLAIGSVHIENGLCTHTKTKWPSGWGDGLRIRTINDCRQNRKSLEDFHTQIESENVLTVRQTLQKPANEIVDLIVNGFGFSKKDKGLTNSYFWTNFKRKGHDFKFQDRRKPGVCSQ